MGGLGGSEENITETEGDGGGLRFPRMSGASRRWITGSGDGGSYQHAANASNRRRTDVRS
jgi:hypothetical protein